MTDESIEARCAALDGRIAAALAFAALGYRLTPADLDAAEEREALRKLTRKRRARKGRKP